MLSSSGAPRSRDVPALIQRRSRFGRKRAINATATLDFCSDIVEGIPDPQGDEDEEVGKKKRQPRKPKGKAEEEEDNFLDDDSDEPTTAKPEPRQVKRGEEDDDYEES